jgi:hypothetical protein
VIFGARKYCESTAKVLSLRKCTFVNKSLKYLAKVRCESSFAKVRKYHA